jgi:hypothetical protein
VVLHGLRSRYPETAPAARIRRDGPPHPWRIHRAGIVSAGRTQHDTVLRCLTDCSQVAKVRHWQQSKKRIQIRQFSSPTGNQESEQPLLPVVQIQEPYVGIRIEISTHRHTTSVNRVSMMKNLTGERNKSLGCLAAFVSHISDFFPVRPRLEIIWKILRSRRRNTAPSQVGGGRDRSVSPEFSFSTNGVILTKHKPLFHKKVTIIQNFRVRIE